MPYLEVLVGDIPPTFTHLLEVFEDLVFLYDSYLRGARVLLLSNRKFRILSLLLLVLSAQLQLSVLRIRAGLSMLVLCLVLIYKRIVILIRRDILRYVSNSTLNSIVMHSFLVLLFTIFLLDLKGVTRIKSELLRFEVDETLIDYVINDRIVFDDLGSILLVVDSIDRCAHLLLLKSKLALLSTNFLIIARSIRNCQERS